MNASELVGRAFLMQAPGWSGHFRVILVASDFDLVALYPLVTKKRKPSDFDAFLAVTAMVPRMMVLSRFLGMPEDERQEVEIELPVWTNRAFEELTEEQKAKYRQLAGRMEALSSPDVLLSSLLHGTYNRMLQERATTLGVHRTTLARDASRYFLCGGDVRKACMLSLLGKGSTTKVREVKKKLGRKPKLVATGHLPSAEGINVDDFVKQKIRLFLAGEKDRSRKTLAQLFRDFEAKGSHIAAGSLADGTTVYRTDPRLKITLGQFTYHVKKLETVRQRQVATIGRAKFNKDRRLLIGTARDGIQYPGQCYIIDSTVADVYLVSAFDRKLLVGRPTIYVVIDAFSSLIVAVHVSLENSSLEQAKVALYRAMTSKDRLLEELGLDSLLSALPQGCTPASVFADRGELLSNGGRRLVEELEVRLSLAAPYRAEWKSLVERYFGVQNELVIHWVPGAVRARARERGDRDVRHDAVLTTHGLLRLMLSLAAEWNLTKDMSTHVSAAMLRENIEATPVGFWRYGLEHLHGSPHFLQRDDAIRTCLPLLTAKANRMGLEALNGLRYTSDWMTNDDAFFAQTHDGNAHIYLDPDRPLSAFMREPDTGKLKPVDLVDNRQYDELDVSLEDIRDAESFIALQRAEHEIGHDEALATLKQMRQKVLRDEEHATRLASQDDTRSNSRRIADMKDNRRRSNIGSLGLDNKPSWPDRVEPVVSTDSADEWALGLEDTFGRD